MTVTAQGSGRSAHALAAWRVSSAVEWISVPGAILLVFAPVVLPFLFTATYAVDAPQGDQWDFIPTIRQLYEGRLTFEQLFAQYTEQRLLFPRLIMLLMVVITRYNVFGEMYLSSLIIFATCLTFFIMFLRMFPGRNVPLLAFLPVTLILCSFRQWDGLLWGWLLQWYLVTIGCLVSLYFGSYPPRRRRYFVLSAAGAVFATFSMASGLLVWPLRLIQMFWQQASHPDETKGRFVTAVAAWCGMWLAVTILYFRDYVPPEFQNSPLYLLRDPVQSAGFVVMAIGSTLSLDEQQARSFGLALVPLYAVILLNAWNRRSAISRYDLVCLALVLFSLLFVAQILFGRSWLGLGKAMESKYAPITLLGLAGVYMLALSAVARGDRHAQLIFGMLVATICIGLVSSYTVGLDEGQRALRDREAYPYYLATYRLQDDSSLQQLGHDADYVRKYAAVLEKYGLSAFRQPLPRLIGVLQESEPATFFVDEFNGRVSPLTTGVQLDRRREPRIVISGWAVDRAAGEPAAAVFIDAGGRLQIPARYGLVRPDLADMPGFAPPRKVGFRAEFASALLRPGPQVLRVLVVSADGASYRVGQHTLNLDVQ
ncbi:MAG: hypothetical protein IT307_16800 [Chloroflexi bacterium]|nr:hypothetical protein [Chloroflexota bacterium]